MIDMKYAAKALDGRQYTEEGTKEFFALMKDAGLVAVFGSSDDLMEFRGAIYDEGGHYQTRFDATGLVQSKCEDDCCPYWEKIEKTFHYISCDEDDMDTTGYNFRMYNPDGTEFKNTHSFLILEDDDVYCTGLIFDIKDL